MSKGNVLEREIVFKYKTQPSFGVRDEYGGFEIAIYENKELEYTKFLFSNKVDSIYKRKVDIKCVERIINIIDENKSALNKVLKNLNNGTLDGSLVSVIFYKIQEIKGTSLKYIDLEKVKVKNHNYYTIYKNNIISENLVVCVLSEIKEVLLEYGIKIGSFECSFNEVK